MPWKKFQFASKLNPFWKRVARSLVRECESCGAPRIYSVFDAYINSEKLTCLGCSTAYRLALTLIR